MKDLKSNVVEISNNQYLIAPNWFDDPDSFDKEEFIKEMENIIFVTKTKFQSI